MILELDFETTALCQNRGGIIEIGARWHTPHGTRTGEFFRECRPHPDTLVEEEALKVNGYTRERIFDVKRMTEAQAIVEFIGWARGGIAETDPQIKVVIAAWNAHFEMRHLRAALERANIGGAYQGLRHSVIDPFSILVADIIRGDVSLDKPLLPPPEHWGTMVTNSDCAAQILGIAPEVKPHNALNGARQVHAFLQALRVVREEA